MNKHLHTYAQSYIWAGIIGILFLSFLILPTFQKEVNKNVVAHTPSLEDDVVLAFPQGKINAQIADTPNTRELGLSYRASIGDDEGMIFVFDKPDNYGFWMKDMKFPIDMVWFSEGGQIVYMEENLSPKTYPKVFMNKPKAKYVLELNANLAKKYGLYLGTKVDLSGIKAK